MSHVQQTEEIKVAAISRGGRLIELEDGRRWEVVYLDAVRSIDWEADSTWVRIREDPRGPYPYMTVLLKVGSCDTVRARIAQ